MQLLAAFLAGDHPEASASILELHVQAVRDMIPIAERELFSTRPRPKEWPPL